MNRMRNARLGLFLFGCVAAIAAPAQPTGFREDPAGKDELFEVQTMLEMEGIRMPMPGGARRVCAAKGGDDAGVPTRDDCRLVDSKRTGNRLAYRMTCKSAKSDYVATGETTWAGSGYEGTMKMTGTMDGSPVDMKMSYSGRRVGNCVASLR